jgi:hypothetical protein
LEVVRKKWRDLKNVAYVCSVIANIHLHGRLNRQIRIEDHRVLDRM